MKPAGGAAVSLTVQTAVKLSRANLNRLNDEAARRVVSRNRLIDAALNEWFERHEGDV